MGTRAVTAVLVWPLAASAGLGAVGSATPGSVTPGLSSAEQKYSWSDLDALKATVHQGLTLKAKVAVSPTVVSDYKGSAEEYAKALKDKAFMQAAQNSGICKKLVPLEEQSAPDIEDDMPDLMANLPGLVAGSQSAMECRAVAAELTADTMKQELAASTTVGDVEGTLIELISSRSAVALCEGKGGLKDWLKKNVGLRAAHPEAYQLQLRVQLNGRVGPILRRFTERLCKPGVLQRFDAPGLGAPVAPMPRAGSGTSATLLASLALASAGLGLGALAARRAIRQAGALEAEPLGPEVLLEGGTPE